MNPKESLTIATHNILIGGMALKESHGEADVVDWLLKHGMTLIAKSESFVAKKLLLNGRNPTQELIDAFAPDLILLNEVLPDFHDRSIPSLQKNGYHVVVGRAPYVAPPLTRAVVLASKFRGEEIDFKIPGKAGSGSCGLKISELGLIVLALHPSAFNKKIRDEQIHFTADRVKELLVENPGFQIVIAGDFNVTGEQLDPYFQELDLKRHSLPSFPHSSLMNSFNIRHWIWLRHILDLQQGRRDLDHIFVPSSWGVIELTSLQTTSDHLAIILKTDFYPPIR